MRDELARLQARLYMLTADDAKVAAVQPDVIADPEGRTLSLLLEWRRQRLHAISAEIDRLHQVSSDVQAE